MDEQALADLIQTLLDSENDRIGLGIREVKSIENDVVVKLLSGTEYKISVTRNKSAFKFGGWINT